MRTLLALPPLTLTNGAYASVPYLTGYLRSRGCDVEQTDWNLDFHLKLLSVDGLARIRSEILEKKEALTKATQFFLSRYEEYAATITPVVRFLQGKDRSLAVRLAHRTFVPEGPRFSTIAFRPDVVRLFGSLGTDDLARYVASWYVQDLLDVIREGVDPDFDDAHKAAQASFNPALKRLEQAREHPTCVDAMFEELVL